MIIASAASWLSWLAVDVLAIDGAAGKMVLLVLLAGGSASDGSGRLLTLYWIRAEVLGSSSTSSRSSQERW